MKKFIVIGNQNIIAYKEVFPLLKDRKVFIHKNIMYFDGANYAVTSAWISSIKSDRVIEPLVLTKTYNEDDYPKYDNYDAIEVSKVKDIPYDYDGVMGVPITFFDKWDGEEFEVVGLAADQRCDEPWNIMGKPTYVDERHKNCVNMVLDGKSLFGRILIRRKG